MHTKIIKFASHPSFRHFGYSVLGLATTFRYLGFDKLCFLKPLGIACNYSGGWECLQQAAAGLQVLLHVVCLYAKKCISSCLKSS